MMRKASRVALLLVAGMVHAAQAQTPVRWKAETAATRTAPGEKFTVVVRASLDFGWYIYGIRQGSGGPVAAKVTLPKGQPFTLVDSVTSTQPTIKFDENFGVEVEVHEVAVDFGVPVEVTSEADPGAYEVGVNVRFQACDATICLPAQTEKLSVPVKVASKSRPFAATR